MGKGYCLEIQAGVPEHPVLDGAIHLVVGLDAGGRFNLDGAPASAFDRQQDIGADKHTIKLKCGFIDGRVVPVCHQFSRLPQRLIQSNGIGYFHTIA